MAVVGSGPAGLACAAQLNKAGHMVTVFERADRIGGLLMYGIPNMKLDKDIVERRVDLLADEGVEFVTSSEVGKNFPAEVAAQGLRRRVLCGGATQPSDLPIEGRELKGIHFAMEFLPTNTKSLLDSNHEDGQYISAKGKDVIVIGGGDTGTDCVGTSLRHGCKSLVQLEIVPSPPTSARPTTRGRSGRRSTSWTTARKRRRRCSATTRASTRRRPSASSATRRATSRSCTRCRSSGSRTTAAASTMKEVPGSEKVLPAELVLLAMGFLGPEKQGLLDELGVKLDERTNVAADGNKQTSVPGVFAAGDMRAASRWSCGRSTRAAGRPAESTST